MHIVLLGATGFVGRHLLPALSARGHRCRVICRNRERSRALNVVPRVELWPAPRLELADLAGVLRGCDAAVNLIGILNERGRDGSGFRRVHVATAECLAEACRIAGVRRVIQVSALRAGEGASHYLRSKAEAEEILLRAAHLDTTVLRPAVIFGEGDSFFNRFAGLLKWSPVLPLACPGARMQPVFVGDVAAAVCAVLERPDTIGRKLDLVGPEVYTLRELVAYAARTLGLRRWIVGLPNPVSRLQAAIMDFLPGKPFSTDNFRSLQVDSVSGRNALPELGISPRSLRSVVPFYLAGSPRQRSLDEWRRGGRA